MKKIILLLLLVLVVLGASAQINNKVDLQKLGNILRSQNLSMGYEVKGDLFEVRDNATNLSGIMNLKGEMLLQPKYSFLGFLDYGGLIYVSTSDSTYGLMNRQMQWVARDLDEDGLLSENNFNSYGSPLSVGRNHKYGLIDSLGNWLMPAENEMLWTVDGKNGWVQTKEELYDYRQKRLLLEGVWWTFRCSDNLFVVMMNKKKVGIIDTFAHWVVEPIYSTISSRCSEGMISVWNYDKCGYIDTLGKEVIPLDYSYASDFSNGLAVVRKGDKWGYIDKSGREVVPFKYDVGFSFKKNGRALVRRKIEGKDVYHIIDRKGNILSTIEGRLMLNAREEAILWQLAGKKYLLTDYEGKELASYDEILFDEGDEDYSEEDMIAVRQGSKWGLADKEYRLLVPCKYRMTYGFGNGPGTIVALDNGSTRYIDRNGKTIFKLDGMIIVSNVGKDLYKVLIRSDGDSYYRVGLVDRKGRSTFSKEELKTAKKIHLSDLIQAEKDREGVEIDDLFGPPMEQDSDFHPVFDTLDSEEIFICLEESPEFPGGMDSLAAFLSANIQYPIEARNNSIEGRVFVQFVIEKDGSISNIKVLRDIGGGCGEEVVRVIGLMPKWKPGKQRGHEVRSQYILPVTFELAKEKQQPHSDQ